MLLLVVGPPAGGKSTWVCEHAKPGDVTIDFDALANALSPHDSDDHAHSAVVAKVTKAARQAAIDAAVTSKDDCDVYVIHSTPSRELINKYRALGAKIIVVDPGRDVVVRRARKERSHTMHGAITAWYDEISEYAASIEQPMQFTTWVAPTW